MYGKYGWADDSPAGIVPATVTPHEEVRPMKAVRTWVLPLAVMVGRLT
jgi:hypothetical protein